MFTLSKLLFSVITTPLVILHLLDKYEDFMDVLDPGGGNAEFWMVTGFASVVTLTFISYLTSMIPPQRKTLWGEEGWLNQFKEQVKKGMKDLFKISLFLPLSLGILLTSFLIFIESQKSFIFSSTILMFVLWKIFYGHRIRVWDNSRNSKKRIDWSFIGPFGNRRKTVSEGFVKIMSKLHKLKKNGSSKTKGRVKILVEIEGKTYKGDLLNSK